MNSLVKMTEQKELVVSLDDINEFSGVKYERVQRIIRDNSNALNNIGGNIPTDKKSGSSAFKTDLFLNEQQATLVMMFMKNTPQVREFKIKLVKEFFKMREHIKSAREIDKELLDTFVPKDGYLKPNKQGSIKSQQVRGYYSVNRGVKIGSKKAA